MNAILPIADTRDTLAKLLERLGNTLPAAVCCRGSPPDAATEADLLR